jgi:MoaA/NifB/PqqE/SkfB family radical SAM enzyme
VSTSQNTNGRGDYGPARLTIELTNICNLHCSYCLRDEEALYASHARHLPLTLFERVIREAKEAIGVTQVIFTGGEPTLHPSFAEIVAAVRAEQLKFSFITNGWNFEKIEHVLTSNRDALSHIAFSLDGITAAEHDKWRGSGSFIRLVKAFARCFNAGIPFSIKVGIRRDTLPQLEAIAMFAARLGAASLNFSHLLPTSAEVEDASTLSYEERTIAEQEIAALSRIFKMKIGIDVGYYNVDEAAPCSPLAGKSCNIDYLGRLTLCCNLSGFRGAAEASDVIADLNVEPFMTAHSRLNNLAEAQLQRRAMALKELTAEARPYLFVGSPCLFCLKSFEKTPWRQPFESSDPLPIFKASTA